MALILAAAVSEFKFFLSLWSENSCNSIMWHARLVFDALSLSLGANQMWFRASGGSQQPTERKERGVGPGRARLDLLDSQLTSLADTCLLITIGGLSVMLSLSSLFLSFLVWCNTDKTYRD